MGEGQKFSHAIENITVVTTETVRNKNKHITLNGKYFLQIFHYRIPSLGSTHKLHIRPQIILGF